MPTYEAASDSTFEVEYPNLCKLYVLAEMILDEVTQSIVLDAIAAKSIEPDKEGHSYIPGTQCIDIVYAGTRDDSPARALLAQLSVEGRSDLAKRTVEKWPRDFVYDCALLLQKQCGYHMRSEKKSVIFDNGV